MQHTNITTTLRALVGTGKGCLTVLRGDDKYLGHVLDRPICSGLAERLRGQRRLGVTANFREIINYFKTPAGETPAGFRVEYRLESAGVVRVDLARDISYDKNGVKRPTQLLFSVDSANPYEIEPLKHVVANMTCNPGIIYDLFINNPKANVGNKFKTRDEVIAELGRILGPGVDMSVELNNPFEEDWQKLLDEAIRFREMLSPYRLVVKVPHTGPVNGHNVQELLTGDKLFQRRYNHGATADFMRGHNLALFLHEHGFRINFTLMFEPYQARMALQARPYFINSFVRHRKHQSLQIQQFLQRDALEELRTFFIQKDYLGAKEAGLDLKEVKRMGEFLLQQRRFTDHEGADGLDAVRHNLRVLRSANLPDTRLIICSMEGEDNYPDIDKMLAEPEFADMQDRVVITAEPQYLAKFTSCSNVVTYQRRFMNAAKGHA